MTDQPASDALARDARTPHPPATPADAAFDDLSTARFHETMARHPVYATFLGLSAHDDELADGSREAVLEDAALAHRFLSAIEAIKPDELSPYYAIERELAIFTTRREIFDIEAHRVWERRASATDEIGDGIFLLFARGTRPLGDRLKSMTARLEQAPQHIEQQKSRLDGVPPAKLWNEMELDAIDSLPTLFDEIIAAAKKEFGADSAEVARMDKAAGATRAALDEYRIWLSGQLARATEDYALGRDKYDELVNLRAFDGLTSDDILEIGEQQLAENRAARAALGKQIDASKTEFEVVDRIKSEHPADFETALQKYRDAMDEARQYVIDHDIATMPAHEQLSVIETPDYMRNVMPFAAYFSAPKFGPQGEGRRGIYIVTRSVDDDPRAMREHNFASIYNTSIHEAYPGHHQQLSAANEHPSLVRAMVDAPEFVEGWAMYSELMMREEGFDTDVEHRVMMHTDAIWRACRIILDVKLHRGDISVDDAIDFMVEQTAFERPNAAAEVNRYTYTPTYQLSYLLGRVLLFRLRDDEKRRLGSAFSLGRFHDAMLSQGSLPVSFQRRLLTA
jgi:uncharacterized protein (DUF885 family)